MYNIPLLIIVDGSKDLIEGKRGEGGSVAPFPYCNLIFFNVYIALFSRSYHCAIVSAYIIG